MCVCVCVAVLRVTIIDLSTVLSNCSASISNVQLTSLKLLRTESSKSASHATPPRSQLLAEALHYYKEGKTYREVDCITL